MNRRTAMVSAIGATSAIVFLAGLFLVYGVEAEQVLKITPEQFDFGTIDEGNAAVVTATVENTGNTSVEITSARTS